MRTLLQDKISRIKVQIKSDYLAGETVPKIADRLGIKPRGVYYHLGNLSPDDKSIHAMNSALRYQIKREEEYDQREGERVTQGVTAPSRLEERDLIADYIARP